MKAADFISVPDDLVSTALTYGRWLESRGFTVKKEPYTLGLPYTPVFLGKRGQSFTFFEIMSKPDLNRLGQWSSYAKSCHKETRVCLGVPEESDINDSELKALRTLGIGLWKLSDGTPQELIAAQDLALHMELPSLPIKLRKGLGSAYDLINKGHWHEGFEVACIELERQARIYLNAQIRTRGISVAKSSKKNYTPKEIRTMTIGNLAIAFARIPSPNGRDTRILQALEHINRDRITVVHYRESDARRESRLRKNVGKHMFILVQGLKDIHNIRN